MPVASETKIFKCVAPRRSKGAHMEVNNKEWSALDISSRTLEGGQEPLHGGRLFRSAIDARQQAIGLRHLDKL